MTAYAASKETYPSACRTKPDRVSCVGLCGLLATQFGEDCLGFSDAEQFRPLGNHSEVAGRQLVECEKPQGRFGPEKAPKTRSALL